MAVCARLVCILLLLAVYSALSVDTTAAESNSVQSLTASKEAGVSLKAAKSAFSGIFNQPTPVVTKAATSKSQFKVRLNQSLTFALIVGVFCVPLLLLRLVLLKVDNNVSPILQPSLTALYQEMMNLLFVGMGGYILHQAAVVRQLSLALLPGEDPLTFSKLYESVNLVVMVGASLYFLFAVAAIGRASRTMTKWRRLEHERKQPDRSKLSSEAVQFAILRNDFVARDVTRARAMDAGFDFAEYLCQVHGAQVARMIGVRVLSWLVAALLVLCVVAPCMLLEAPLRAIAYAVIGYAALIPLLLLHIKLGGISKRLLRKAPDSRLRAASTASPSGAGSGGATPSSFAASTPAGTGTPFALGATTNGGAFSRSPSVGNVQQSWFPRGEGGPVLFIAAFRFYYLLSALYLAMLYPVILDGLNEGDSAAGNAVLMKVLAVVAALPPLLAVAWVGTLLPQIATISSIEFMRRSDVVDSSLVTTRIATASLASTLLLNMHTQMFHRQVHSHFARQPAVLHAAAVDQDLLVSAFNAVIAKGESSTVGLLQLSLLFRWLGVQLSTRQLQALLGGKGRGRADFCQFKLMVSSVAGLAVDDQQVHELVESCLGSPAPGESAYQYLCHTLYADYNLTLREAETVAHQYRTTQQHVLDANQDTSRSVDDMPLDLPAFARLLRHSVASVSSAIDLTHLAQQQPAAAGQQEQKAE